MKITINGQEKNLPNAQNLQLAIETVLTNSSRVIAELNGQIVKKNQWPATPVKEGDTIELVSFVGGG